MGQFKNIEIEIIDLYHSDRLSEIEIAKQLNVPLLQVHDVLVAYERNDMDYDLSDTDADESYHESDYDDDYNAEDH